MRSSILFFDYLLLLFDIFSLTNNIGHGIIKSVLTKGNGSAMMDLTRSDMNRFHDEKWVAWRRMNVTLLLLARLS